MKTRKMTRKLVLNKKTVANLDSRSMRNVQGGDLTNITCGRLCETIDLTCYETQCGSCFNTCPVTLCDTECSC